MYIDAYRLQSIGQSLNFPAFDSELDVKKKDEFRGKLPDGRCCCEINFRAEFVIVSTRLSAVVALFWTRTVTQLNVHFKQTSSL